MNSTQQKFRQQPAWGNTKVINSIQQHYIVYSYTLHKKNLDQIKIDPSKKMVDNTEPQSFKEKQEKFNQTKSKLKLLPLNLGGKNKPERQKHLEQDIENGSLINRMMQITEKGSMYNKNLLEKQQFKPDKNNYATHRKNEAFRVNKDNLLIHNRLEKVQSTISFNDYQKEYDKYKRYKDNITRSSRRIFNCFIKTEQNQELLATSSTAYGKFTNSKTLSSGTKSTANNIVSKKHLKSNKKSSKNKNFQTEEDADLHKFSEDNQSHQLNTQLTDGGEDEQENSIQGSRNSQLHSQNTDKQNQETHHYKSNSNPDKMIERRKNSEQAEHIKIQEQNQQQEDSKVLENKNHEDGLQKQDEQQQNNQKDQNIQQNNEEKEEGQQQNINQDPQNSKILQQSQQQQQQQKQQQN